MKMVGDILIEAIWLSCVVVTAVLAVIAVTGILVVAHILLKKIHFTGRRR